jgi:hypothetical protein
MKKRFHQLRSCGFLMAEMRWWTTHYREIIEVIPFFSASEPFLGLRGRA